MSKILSDHKTRIWLIFRLILFIVLQSYFSGISQTTSVKAENVSTKTEPLPDSRLGPLRHVNSYFPFTPSASPEEWATRARQVRQRILVSLGLWPMPTQHPLEPIIHGRIVRGDYTVENVYFQSMPGFYVTGNLYRPVGKTGKFPGVICPHGHWSNGRFYEESKANMLPLVAAGAERYYEGGRSPLQSRCVGLARMGCVVFHYDMLGYADSKQLSLDLIHRFAKQIREMNTPENWGLFSPRAETHTQSAMGLQTFNSIRALDFIISLPEVDPARIAVTGASGGGTQTMILCGIDSRPALSFPAVMPSTAMQGGCTCENACGLRVGTGNMEFAALFAPKPQGITAADDWTIELASKGFPELQTHYRILGAPDNVILLNRTDFQHNYNAVSRNAMYRLANKHFGLGLEEPIEEQDYQRLTEAQMSVWDSEHPAPDNSVDFERGLLRWWHEDSEAQLSAATPNDVDSWKLFQELYGIGLDVIIGRNLSEKRQFEWEPINIRQDNHTLVSTARLHNITDSEVVPVMELKPVRNSDHIVIWLDRNGAAGLLDKAGVPIAPVQALLDKGTTVYGVDLFYQGEFLEDGKPITRTRQVEFKIGISSPRKMRVMRDAAAYTFGYNYSVFSQRVHDVLSLVGYLCEMGHQESRIDLVGLAGAGHWAAAALAQSKGKVHAAAIDSTRFRFSNVEDLFHPDFLPGGAKYGDLPGMIALTAPTPMWIAGEDSDSSRLAVQVYEAAGAGDRLHFSAATGDDIGQESVRWLLDQ